MDCERPSIISKCMVLSTILTIFDPLGLIRLVVVAAKLSMQKLWQARINWDNPIAAVLHEEWQYYQQTLPELEEIRIPRWIIGCSNVLITEIPNVLITEKYPVSPTHRYKHSTHVCTHGSLTHWIITIPDL